MTKRSALHGVPATSDGSVANQLVVLSQQTKKMYYKGKRGCMESSWHRLRERLCSCLLHPLKCFRTRTNFSFDMCIGINMAYLEDLTVYSHVHVVHESILKNFNGGSHLPFCIYAYVRPHTHSTFLYICSHCNLFCSHG